MQKQWHLPTIQQPPSVDGIHPVASRLFAGRGIHTDEEIRAFLNTDWDGRIYDPFLFSHMEEGVQRTFAALKNGERITVHGDYDADGVTGSAVVITTLRALKERLSSSAIVDWYIPHRDKEGYGLNPTSVQTLSERGTNLVITVDCGIANVAEIALAREKGMDVIVLDHHQFGEVVPDAILIHPRLPGEHYPFPHLAAVGVSWKFACGLITEARRLGLDFPEGWEKWLLDFVSIATVTDMVPMVGENRVLERYGLMVLNKTRRPGLRALIRASGFELGGLTTESVAFGLGPRINAAGRMDHAEVALRLMLAETDEEATVLAGEVESFNRERQKAVLRIMGEAEKQLETAVSSHAVAFWNEAWPPALVGLVAGKFFERTGKPTIAIGKNGDRWVGSGRSFAGYDIATGIQRACGEMLNHAGGHVQACGFSFDAHEPQAIAEKFFADAAQQLSGVDCSPILNIDVELDLTEVDWSLIETLDQLEPYGVGFSRPQFLSTGVRVISRDLMGKTQKHVRCVLESSSGRTAKFVGFNMSDRLDIFALGNRVDVVYDVSVNEWNGRKEVQCKLIDVRASVPVA